MKTWVELKLSSSNVHLVHLVSKSAEDAQASRLHPTDEIS